VRPRATRLHRGAYPLRPSVCGDIHGFERRVGAGPARAALNCSATIRLPCRELGPVTIFEPETTPVEPEQPAESTAATTSTPWGWIILGVVLVAALVAGIVIWRRRQSGSAAWSRHMADLTQRSFVLLDDVPAQGSVVTGHVQALAPEAQTLETRAPDDLARSAAAHAGSDF
jgi:hypothetical protein